MGGSLYHKSKQALLRREFLEVNSSATIGGGCVTCRYSKHCSGKCNRFINITRLCAKKIRRKFQVCKKVAQESWSFIKPKQEKGGIS